MRRVEIAGRRDAVEAPGIADHAEAVAERWEPTRRAGLSLADRVCLALAPGARPTSP